MNKKQILFLIFLLSIPVSISAISYFYGYHDTVEHSATVDEYNTYKSVSRGNIYTHYTVYYKLSNGEKYYNTRVLDKPIIGDKVILTVSRWRLDTRSDNSFKKVWSIFSLFMDILSVFIALGLVPYILLHFFMLIWKRLEK